MESPRPLPPQPPERGGPTPSTKRGSRNRPVPLRFTRPGPYCHTRHAGTRRAGGRRVFGAGGTAQLPTVDQLHAQNEPESPVPFRHKRRNAADQLHAQNKPESPVPFRHTRRNAADQLHAQNEPESPRPLPPQTPERGGPTPCTKQAGIAPAPSATHAGTRRTNSMHKTSRNRPVPFRHTRRNAADQLHAQNKPESPRPLPPQTPQRGGATPCTKRAGIAPARSDTNAGTRRTNSMHKTSRIAPAPSATNAGTRRTNSMHKTSRNRPGPFRHKRAGTRRTNSMHKTSRNRPGSATHAGTRRTNSMHKTSRNRPGPFRHKRRNAAI